MISYNRAACRPSNKSNRKKYSKNLFMVSKYTMNDEFSMIVSWEKS